MVRDNLGFQYFHCRHFMFTCAIMFDIIAIFTAFIITMTTIIFVGDYLYFQIFHFLLLYGNKKNRLKNPRQKIKKISITNLKIFFWPRDANFSLWSQIFDFPKVF
jgi:hypothetical protein